MSSLMPRHIAESSPYVGPRPFERQDEKNFCGREYEANELVSLIIAHREILLYAQSGTGKTSLLHAGVIPRLERAGVVVLSPAHVSAEPVETVNSSQSGNVFVFNLLQQWRRRGLGGNAEGNVSLGEFMRQIKSPADAEASTRTWVVILDQFEEFFTNYPERWQDRQDFLEQVRDALNDDPEIHIVFSMREEHIAQLDSYASILPERFGTRVRLERLRPREALAAIAVPAEKTGRPFDPGIAHKLVEQLCQVRVPRSTPSGEATFLPGEFVEPLHIQLVCDRIWRNWRPLERGQRTITVRHLEQYGDLDDTLVEYYERTVTEAVAHATQTARLGLNRTRAVGRMDEARLRTWIQHSLIDAYGNRKKLYGGANETEGLPNEVIRFLVERRLVHRQGAEDAPVYELAHDRLLEPIQLSNQKYAALTSAEYAVHQSLEEKAAVWNAEGRSYDRVLTAQELEEFTRLQAHPGAAFLSISDALSNLVLFSRGRVINVKRP